jgi:HEPN domain-containing protein
MVTKEVIEVLMKRSRRFLDLAKYNIEKGDYDLAAFNLEQGLQLYLKAEILKNGARFPHTYDLIDLLEFLYEIKKDEIIRRIISEYAVELGCLTDAYIMARYFTRKYTKEEVEKLLNAVENIISKIERS